MSANNSFEDSDIWPEPPTQREQELMDAGALRARAQCDLIAHIAKICRGYGHIFKPGNIADEKVLNLRRNMFAEEVNETAHGFGFYAPDWEAISWYEPDPVQIADGFVDTVVIALGGLIEFFGEDCARDLWAEVQRTNEAKLGSNGEVVRRADGKVLKPEGWQPPDIEGVLVKHGILPNRRQPK